MIDSLHQPPAQPLGGACGAGVDITIAGVSDDGRFRGGWND